MEGTWMVSLCHKKLFLAHQLQENLRVVQGSSVGDHTMERENEVAKTTLLQCQKVTQQCKRELFGGESRFWEVTIRIGWPQPCFQATSRALGGSRACQRQDRGCYGWYGAPSVLSQELVTFFCVLQLLQLYQSMGVNCTAYGQVQEI